MRNRILLVVAVGISLLLVGCEVRKTDEDTYNVTVPTEKAKEAARQMNERAKEANDQMKEAARETAPVVREKAREAAKAAGEAIENAGKEMKEHAKPGNQP